MIAQFTVSGHPRTWKRTNNVNGRRITPADQRSYQELVRHMGALSRPAGWPMDARYRMTVAVFRKADAGDWDNYGKNVSDALEGVFYDNDRRIKDARCVLEIDRANPRIEVAIEVIG